MDVGASYNREKGGCYYQSSDNSIGIDFDGEYGNFAHELKHAYQFEINSVQNVFFHQVYTKRKKGVVYN